MQVEVHLWWVGEVGTGGLTWFIVLNAACMIDYLPRGQVSNVCTQCKELLALKEKVLSLKVGVAELEQLWEAERFIDEVFRDVVEQSHLPAHMLLRSMRALGMGGIRLGRKETIL